MRDALQYLLGAGIISVLATQLAVWARETRARRRERDGLLRILFAEVCVNQDLLNFLLTVERAGRSIAIAWGVTSNNASSDAWEATRVQLAQHLSSQEIATLASYYTNLARLRVDADNEQKPGPKIEISPGIARELHRKGEHVTRIIKSYVPDAMVDEITAGDVVFGADRDKGPG